MDGCTHMRADSSTNNAQQSQQQSRLNTAISRATGQPLRSRVRLRPVRRIFKAAGRLRIELPPLLRRRSPRDIAVIGCGQFAFATIGYFLRSSGHEIAVCFDVDQRAREWFARAFRVPRVGVNAEEMFETPGVRTVYIASNHASHARYAVRSRCARASCG